MNNITDPVTRMNHQAMSEAEAAEQCYGCHPATGKGDCPIHEPQSTENIRLMQKTTTTEEQQQWSREEAEDIMENLRRIEYESVYDPRDSPPVFCSLCGDDVGSAEEAYDAYRSFNNQTSHLCDECYSGCDSPDNRFVSDKEKRVTLSAPDAGTVTNR